MLKDVKSVDYDIFWRFGVKYCLDPITSDERLLNSQIVNEFGNSGKRYVLHQGVREREIRFRRPEDRFLFLLKFSG